MSKTGWTKDLISEYSFAVGKIYFRNDGLQNYLIFPPSFDIRKLCNRDYVKVAFWRSVGISTKTIEPFEVKIGPEVNHSNEGKISIKFNNTVLIQKAFTFIYKR